MRAHELVASLKASGDIDMAAAVENSVKFDMGNSDELVDMSVSSNGDNTPFPFPSSLFEVSNLSGAGKALFLCVEGGDIDGADDIAFMFAFANSHPGPNDWAQEDLLIKIKRGSEYPDTPVSLRSKDDKLCLSESLERDRERFRNGEALSKESARQSFFAILGQTLIRSMAVFSCSNIEYIDHQPPKFINAKRKKKGKPPFLSYKTLHIKTNDKKLVSVGGGGTHESPRLHLRRGHIRRLQSGNKVWVQSCMVGDAHKGFAKKDYKVSMA